MLIELNLGQVLTPAVAPILQVHENITRNRYGTYNTPDRFCAGERKAFSVHVRNDCFRFEDLANLDRRSPMAHLG